jgi:hypothetical protein
MHDAPLVRLFESFRKLPRDVERFVEREWSMAQPFGEILAVHELHGEEISLRAIGPSRASMAR